MPNISKIYRSFKKIARYQVVDFYDNTSDGQEIDSVSFFDHEEDISWIIKFSNSILEQNKPIGYKYHKHLREMPKKSIEEIEESLDKMGTILDEMRGYKPKEPSLISDKKLADSAVVVEHELDKNRLKKDFQEHFSSFKQAIDPLIINILKEQVFILTTDKNTREGVEKHYKLYEENAEIHKKSGWVWLAVGSVLIFFSICFGGRLLTEIETWAKLPMSADTTFYLVNIFLRTLFFGFLGSLTFWSFKNYRLNKHNELLNRQKALALQTFEDFSNAAVGDIDMRRVVLGKVTSTIFDMQDMGYVAGGKESMDSENSYLKELVHVISSSKKDRII